MRDSHPAVSVNAVDLDLAGFKNLPGLTVAAYAPGGGYVPSTLNDYFNLPGFEGTQYLSGTRLMGANSAAWLTSVAIRSQPI